MRTKTLLLFLFILFHSNFLKSEVRIHPQILGFSPVNSINNDQFYGTLGGYSQNILVKYTISTKEFDYLVVPNFEISMTSYSLIGENGIAIDYLGANYVTSDGFKTIQKEEDLKFKKVIPTSTGMVALHQDHGIYFSNDAINWERKGNAYILHPKGDLIHATNDSDELIISENGGKDWTSILSLSQFNEVQRVVDVVDASTIIVGEVGQRIFHITTDQGANWKTSTSMQGNVLRYNFIDENIGFAELLNGLYVTKDGGETWGGLVQLFASLPETGTPQLWATMNQTIYINLNGNLYYTNDLGETWNFFFQSIGSKFYDIDQKGDVVIIGGRSGYYAISTDGGRFFKNYQWGKEDIMAVKAIDDQTYALGDRKGQVLMLFEGGDSWGKKTSSNGNYNALHFEATPDSKVILSTRIGQPAVSIDAGQRFNIYNVGGGSHFQTLTPNGDIIDVNAGTILKMDANNGQKTEILQIPDANARRITMASNDVGYLFSETDATTMTVFVTKDGWNSYTKAGDINMSITGYISISHIREGHLILTVDGNNERYESSDFGETWTSSTIDFATSMLDRNDVVTGSHFNSPDNFWVITEDGLLFMDDQQFKEEEETTSKRIVKKEIGSIYPNPATNTITVDYPEPISEISIYSMKGKKVLSQNVVENKTFDISSFEKGIYLVQTISAKGIQITSRFIKK